MLDALAFVPTPPRPRLRGQNGIPGGGGLGCGSAHNRQARPGVLMGAMVRAGVGGSSPLQELGELAAVGEAGSAHPDVLLQAQVFHLVLDPVGEGRLSPLGVGSHQSWGWVRGAGVGGSGGIWIHAGGSLGGEFCGLGVLQGSAWGLGGGILS